MMKLAARIAGPPNDTMHQLAAAVKNARMPTTSVISTIEATKRHANVTNDVDAGN